MLTRMVTSVVTATKTVLLIEGTLASVDLVEAILARLSPVAVVPVMQGRRGLELARAEPPALILLDLALPDITGIHVLRQLQADSRTKAIPVITFGTAATAHLAGYLIDSGARAHLTQPLDVVRFLGLAEGLLA